MLQLKKFRNCEEPECYSTILVFLFSKGSWDVLEDTKCVTSRCCL